MVSPGNTDFAEVVEVEYDPSEIEIGKLLEIFFTAHDPTQINGQGNDIGPQYRSVFFYTSEGQRKSAENFIDSIRMNYSKPVVT